MIQSRKFVAAAILAGIALIVAGLLIAPFNASARAAAADGDGRRVRPHRRRISPRFPSVEPAAEHCRRCGAVFKGDLGAAAICAGAVWPNIDASCLSTADGSPAHAVRTDHHRLPERRRTRPCSSASRPAEVASALTDIAFGGTPMNQRAASTHPPPGAPTASRPLPPPSGKIGRRRAWRPGLGRRNADHLSASFWSEAFRSPSRRPSRSPLSCF